MRNLIVCIVVGVVVGIVVGTTVVAPRLQLPVLAEAERIAIEELFYDYYAQFRSDSKHDFDSFFMGQKYF